MFKESVKMSVKAIATNKMRSFLTMLGIIIGVMALITLVSMANGTTRSIQSSVSSLGSNTLTVRISDDKGVPYHLDDLDELANDLESIDAISAVSTGQATADSNFSRTYSADDSTADVTLYGTGSSYDEIMGLSLLSGRYFNLTDIENHTNVVIISEDLADTIMGGTSCVGETIRMNGVDFEIIGILESDSSSSSAGHNSPSGSSRRSSSSYQEYTAYLPYTSLLRLTDSVSSSISEFVASAQNDEKMDAAESELEEALLAHFLMDSDAFTIQNQSEIADAMEDVNNTMALMLGGIAAISLLVGGIGIMNIMLVSVTERTREIGIRKAIGAKKSTILQQFLIEAIIISLFGCGIGIAGSWIVLRIISVMTETAYTLSPGVLWISIIFSSAIGILFGLYPASRAAKKNPIEALRYAG